MRVVVTGASGMLATDLVATWRASGDDVTPCDRAALDVCDLERVRARLVQLRPDVVVHAAAHTDVDAAEANPDAAFQVNWIGTANVALGCADVGSELVYVSSCGVFDGRKAAPYTESDAANPLTQHHRSKLAGEQAVVRTLARHYVLRPGWLFGGTAAHRRNFVAQRLREAEGQDRLEAAGDRFGTPTYTVDFALAARRIVEARAYGLYHVANGELASRCEYVRACLAAAGSNVDVVPVASDRFRRAAPVPAWEALETWHLKLRGFPPLRPWREAVTEYVTTRLLPELAEARS